MGISVGELFVSLGVKADTQKLKDFSESVSGTVLKVTSLVAALVGVSYEFQHIAHSAIDTAAGFREFSAESGLSVDKLQEWTTVAERSNVKADTLKATILRLQSIQQGFKIGEGNIRPYNILGIGDPNSMTPFELLEKLLHGARTKFKGDVGQQRKWLEDAGVPSEMMQLPDNMDSHVDKRLKLTGKELAQLNSLREQFTALKQEFDIGTSKMFADMAPQIAQAVINLKEFLVTLEDIIRSLSALKGFGTLLNNFFTMFGYLKPSDVNKFYDSFGGMMAAQSLEADMAARLGAAGGRGPVTVNQTIHTTADAKGTADLSAQEVGKVVNSRDIQRTSQHLNTGGR